jgi:hypothetical protein
LFPQAVPPSRELRRRVTHGDRDDSRNALHVGQVGEGSRVTRRNGAPHRDGDER